MASPRRLYDRGDVLELGSGLGGAFSACAEKEEFMRSSEILADSGLNLVVFSFCPNDIGHISESKPVHEPQAVF